MTRALRLYRKDNGDLYYRYGGEELKVVVVSPSDISIGVESYLSENPPSAAWSGITGKPETYPPSSHDHAYSPVEHNHDLTYSPLGHTHPASGDGEVSVVLDQDQATNSASFVDCAGLGFTAEASSTYIIEFFLVFQSSSTTYGVGYSINGPSAPTFCVGHVDLMLAASTRYVNNITGYNLVNGTSGSVVATNTNYPGYVWVMLKTTNGGPVTLRHRSESTSGTIKTMAGSTLRYRKVA